MNTGTELNAVGATVGKKIDSRFVEHLIESEDIKESWIILAKLAGRKRMTFILVRTDEGSFCFKHMDKLKLTADNIVRYTDRDVASRLDFMQEHMRYKRKSKAEVYAYNIHTFSRMLG